MKPVAPHAIVLAVLVTWGSITLPCSPSHGTDITGSVGLTGTTTTAGELETTLLRQQYTFQLFQPLTPYFNLRFGYLQSNLDTDSNQVLETSRRFRAPELQLTYSRGFLSGSIRLENRTIDSSSSTDFEADSLFGSFSWNPHRGPQLSFTYRDQRNVADPDVFGEENRTKGVGLRADYQRRFWFASYVFSDQTFENERARFTSDQVSHQLRLSASRSFMSRKIQTSLSASGGRLDRTTAIGDLAETADPITPSQGLFAVDTSPGLGELEPAPDLIDSDRETPVAPPINIGGANTFRNIGIDIGVTRQVNRLQVFVDDVSGSNVVWQVFHSRDNLVWETVDGVTSRFDENRLRYTIDFTELPDRFFKVVNVSQNLRPEVLVTEIRALQTIEIGPGPQEVDSNRYRVAARASYSPTERISGAVDVFAYNDEALADGFVRRDFKSEGLNASFWADLRKHFRLRASYRTEKINQGGVSPLDRELDTAAAGLRWTPIPTVDALLSTTYRKESSEQGTVQESTSLDLTFVTDFLPTLSATSLVGISRLQDPFTDSSRDTFRWNEELRLQVTLRWQLAARFGYRTYDSATSTVPDDSHFYGLTTSWQPTNYLALSADYHLDDSGLGRTRTQRASLSYNPGPKLTLSFSYFDTETGGSINTSSSSINFTYRARRNVRLLASYSLSGSGGVDSDALTFGLRVFF
ncbi:MAG: hypothetical protein WBO54_17650 [Thermoanaerobaculia bacterium]